MSFYNGILNFNDSPSVKGERGERGFPGVGFKLDENGNYDIQNKKLVNVKQGTNPNDAVTNSQIQSLDNSPGNVQADKAVIYSNTGSVHTNSVYLQDIPDGAGSFNSVRLMTEHQSYDNIHLHVPDLQNFDGYGGRKKSEIMVTSTEQHITGRKTFFDLNVVKPNREFKQIATASFTTAAGSKIMHLRVIAHVSRSHPAVAGNPSTPVGRFWRSLWYVDLCRFFLRFIQTLEQF